MQTERMDLAKLKRRRIDIAKENIYKALENNEPGFGMERDLLSQGEEVLEDELYHSQCPYIYGIEIDKENNLCGGTADDCIACWNQKQ